MRRWIRRATFLLVALWLALLMVGVAQRLVQADTPPDLEQRIKESQAKYEVGLVYENNGDLGTAERYYSEALSLWSENTEARQALQRVLAAKNPPVKSDPWWYPLLSWLPFFGSGGAGGSVVMEAIGWAVMVVVLFLAFWRVGREALRLALLRARGVPLLGLGTFHDPTGRLPGLPHQLATNMNDAGLTFYDEKGAVLPDFTFIVDAGFPQARLLAKFLEFLYIRNVQRINVESSEGDGLIHTSVSLVDTSASYVRYLHVVSVDPAQYSGPGDLTMVVAALVADAILIAVSRDPNTRGILYQRMGDWTNALKEFTLAADAARAKGICGSYYQAHLNLGNLYSFLGLQDKSVAAYAEVTEKAKSPITVALLHAAMACSYQNWADAAPPEQRETYGWLARQGIDKALLAPQKTPLIAYTIACYYSLARQFREALHWLRESVAGDLAYLEYARSDPDMANLREHLGGTSLAEAVGLRIN
jgi:tetratricopeptide (TPR) repeat protein